MGRHEIPKEPQRSPVAARIHCPKTTDVPPDGQCVHFLHLKQTFLHL